jgi:hypothetical protein
MRSLQSDLGSESLVYFSRPSLLLSTHFINFFWWPHRVLTREFVDSFDLHVSILRNFSDIAFPDCNLARFSMQLFGLFGELVLLCNRDLGGL